MSDIKRQMFLFWPKVTGNEKMSDALNMLKDKGITYHEKSIFLTYNGYRNLLIQLYWGATWAGGIDNHFSGVMGKVNEIYEPNNVLHVVLMGFTEDIDTVRLKKNIRDIFGLGNSSCHSSDTLEECLTMERLLFNQNSIHALNYGRVDYDRETFNKLLKFRELVAEEGNQSINHYIIDSSAVLAVYGLRSARDLDYLTDHKEINCIDIDNHIASLCYYPVGLNDLLYNEDYYFWSLGLKFVSLNVLKQFKEKRGQQKDLDDIELLCAVEQGRKFGFRKIRMEWRLACEKKKNRIRNYFENRDIYCVTKLWHLINGKGFR